MEEIYIGRYKVTEELGRGGMGVVYKGEDPVLERTVAIKILPPKKISQKSALERFLREAKVSAKLDHPNIIKIYDIGQEEGIYHIVMEYIEGKTLGEIFESRASVNVKEMTEIFNQVAEAMEYAHSKKVIHRDMKPDNIMVSNDHKAKVMDFGLACLADRHSITEMGAIMGTFSYFSPEQAKGENVDFRSDIYSLGAVFFEMLTGRLPFDAKNPSEMIQKHLNAPTPSVLELNPSVPMYYDKIIKKMMMKNPANRYQSMKEVIDELKEAKRSSMKVKIVKEIKEIEKRKEIETRSKIIEKSKQEKLLSKLQKEEAVLAKLTEDEAVAIPKVLICSNCQHENTLDKKYCSECGNLLSQAFPEAQITPEMHNEFGVKLMQELNYEEALSEFKKAREKDRNYLPAALNLGRICLELHNWDSAVNYLEDAKRINPFEVDVYALLADVYLASGEREKAIKEYKSALKISSNDQAVRTKLALIYMQNNNTDEAINEYQAILMINPRNTEARLQLGFLYASRNLINEAIDQFNEVIKLDSRNEKANIWLGNLYLKKNRLDLAEGSFKRALELNPESAQTLALLGSLNLQINKADEALENLQKAISYDSGNVEARKTLAKMYLKQNKTDMAIQQLEEVLQYHPQDAKISYQLGELYLKEKKTEKALEYFQKSASLYPESAPLHSKLGMLYFKKDANELSLQEYQKAIKIDPYNPPYRENLGVFYYWNNQKEQAIEEMKKAVTLDSQNIDYHKMLGMMYEETGRFEEAIKSYQKALEVSPRDYLTYGLLGKVYAKQELYNLAIEQYKKALELNPKSHLMHIYMAKAYMKLDMIDDAVKEFKTAYEIMPGEAKEDQAVLPKAYLDIGRAYIKSGDFRMAEEVLESADKLDARNSSILFYLGIAKKNLSKLDEAVKSLSRALSLEPQNANIILELADSYLLKNNLARAESLYNKIIKDDQFNLYAKSNLAKIYIKKSQFAKAKDLLDELVVIDQSNQVDYLIDKSYIYIYSKDYREAQNVLNEALRVNKDDWRIYDELAKVMLLTGRKKEALNYWEKALLLAPESSRRDVIEAEIKKLRK